jgi:hypothetical protein
VCPNASALAEKQGRFRDVLVYFDVSSRRRDRIDKVKLAYEVAKHAADLTVLDLNEKASK